MKTTRGGGLIVSCYLFFFLTAAALVLWEPWVTAVTVDQARHSLDPDRAELVNPKWRAVRIEHGIPSEWRYGTKEQNPRGYWMATVRLLGSASILLLLIILNLRTGVGPDDYFLGYESLRKRIRIGCDRRGIRKGTAY